MKKIEEVIKIINMHDDVGIYAITESMIQDYFFDKKSSITSKDASDAIKELTHQDRIAWDKTKQYFRPVSY